VLWTETDILQGPLAKVWLAAHERKLTKAQLLQTSITRSTQAIVEQDEAPLALRLSGQLLLGVVRIYSRKARYLLDDCNEALMKIKLVHIPFPGSQSHVRPSDLGMWICLLSKSLLMRC
jgi:cohesin complex subunit SCC1